MPPLSPTTKWSSNINCYSPTNINSPHSSGFNVAKDKNVTPSKYAGIVRQKIYELEGPNFCFKPLFTGAAAEEVGLNRISLHFLPPIPIAGV